MKYVENKRFKELIKNNKSVKAPLLKAMSGMPMPVGDRQIKFIFSTPTVDRDYDLISQDGIDFSWYKTNPQVYYNHDNDLPIGKCVSIGIEDGNLVGVIEFVPESNPAIGQKAEGILQLCKDGFLSTVSIGFIPLEYEDAEDETRYWNQGVDILKSELLEVSIVGIPSNRSALIQEIGTSPQEPEINEYETPEEDEKSIDNIEVKSSEEPKKHADRFKRIIDALFADEE